MQASATATDVLGDRRVRLEGDEENMRLRQRLTQMTESPHQPQEHRAMLDQISRELPNTIQVRECGRDPQSFTCGMHAFGFEDNPEYAAVARRNVFAGLDFFGWLIASGHLFEIGDHAASRNDLVMYFNGDRPVHIGRVMSGGRVISKWGLGLLWKHGLDEVPDCYGDEVRFFRHVQPDIALEHFLSLKKEGCLITLDLAKWTRSAAGG
jgi:hypothetical protein